MRFVEKPDAATAGRYVEAGNFFWNGGIFLFRADRMAREIRERLPQIHGTLRAMQEAFLAGGVEDETRTAADSFPGIEGISIDYGVMEKASDVEVIPGDFGWSDLGSWRAIYEKLDKDQGGNAVRGGGSLLVHDARGILASSRKGKLVAVVGVDNIVVVDTEDALMVCSLDRDQEVREIVSALKKRKDDRI
jgi:mannose-1-phosphate guanylyltransferase